MKKFLDYFFKDEDVISKCELDKQAILNMDSSIEIAYILEKITGLHVLYWGIVIDSSVHTVDEGKVLF